VIGDVVSNWNGVERRKVAVVGGKRGEWALRALRSYWRKVGDRLRVRVRVWVWLWVRGVSGLVLEVTVYFFADGFADSFMEGSGRGWWG
jgi:hypothetical protein